MSFNPVAVFTKKSARIFSIVFTLTALMVGYQNCGQSADDGGKTNLQVRIPKDVNNQKLSISKGHLSGRSQNPSIFADIWAPAFQPEQTDDLQCFGIIIGSADGALSDQICEQSDAQTIVFGRSALGALRGETLSLADIPAGSARTIHVIGWRSENDAACRSLQDGQDIDAKKLSHPFIIASITQDLAPGDVTIPITASFDNAIELQSCDGLAANPNSLSSRTFSIGGSGTGISPLFPPFPFFEEGEFEEESTPLILSVTGGETADIDEDFQFDSFDTQFGDGTEYLVSIDQQPDGKTCIVNNASGVINGEDITNVEVVCELSEFSIAGTVADLDQGGTLILEKEVFPFPFERGQEPENEVLEITNNGNFSFVDTHNHFDEFNIFVAQHPVGQFCEVFREDFLDNVGPGDNVIANDTGGFDFGEGFFGFIDDANIDDIIVQCGIASFPVLANVNGLIQGRNLTLNNGEDALFISGDGQFAFNDPVQFGEQFNVEITNQPAGQTCVVVNGSGVMGNGPAIVTVNCTPDEFTVGGEMFGLLNGREVTLSLSGGAIDTLVVDDNGSYSFEVPVPSGQVASVTVQTQPIGQICTVVNSNQTIFDFELTNIDVTCVTQQFTIGGTIAGLDTNLANQTESGLTLQNNEGDDLFTTENGDFTFDTPLDSGQDYDVTVSEQPVGQFCSVNDSNGEVLGENIVNITVDCELTEHFVGGSISGLVGDLTLEINEGESIELNQDGAYQFPTPLFTPDTYNVVVLNQPSGQTCTVANGSGTIFGQDVNNVNVTCVPNGFTIGGSVIGLGGEETVTIVNNGTDTLNITQNGIFTFNDLLQSGETFNVVITSQPGGQSCSVDDGQGTAFSSIANIIIFCADDPFGPVSPGTIDQTFGFNGIVGFNPFESQDDKPEVAVDSNSNPYISFVTNNNTESHICRLDTQGNIDINFDQDGCRVIDSAALNATGVVQIEDIFVDSNDNLLFTGISAANMVTGQLDDFGNFEQGFNQGAGFIIDASTCGLGVTRGLSIKEDPGIPGLVGVVGISNNDMAFWNFFSGDLNTSFSADGRQCFSFGAVDFNNDFRFDTGHNLVSGGLVNDQSIISRVNANGSIDTDFNNSTRIQQQFGGQNDQTVGIEIDHVGRIYAAQITNTGVSVTRLNPDGTLDNSWGDGGVLFINLGTDTGTAADIARDANGDILVLGTRNNGEHDDVFVVRIDHRTGQLDTSFGVGGMFQFDGAQGPDEDDTANSIVVAPDGSIYIGFGATSVEIGDTDAVILKLEPAPQN